MYENKKIFVATKHQKELAIKPVFEAKLGCFVSVTEKYDTDIFGTFSGEINRNFSAYDTCVEKAKLAAKKYGIDYVVASEGSFGSHPVTFCMPIDTEILVFYDLKENIFISEEITTVETNYNGHNLYESIEYLEFLEKVNFPSHKVILKDVGTNTVLQKAISDHHTLSMLISESIKKYNTLRIETDMRAHCNPTRMKIIGKLAEKLACRIATLCPHCQTPGFGKVKKTGNLSCEHCQSPTIFYKNTIISCLKCDYKSILPRDDGLVEVPQKYCSFCNP